MVLCLVANSVCLTSFDLKLFRGGIRLHLATCGTLMGLNSPIRAVDIRCAQLNVYSMHSGVL